MINYYIFYLIKDLKKSNRVTNLWGKTDHVTLHFIMNQYIYISVILKSIKINGKRKIVAHIYLAINIIIVNHASLYSPYAALIVRNLYI